jgi:tricorn protease
MIKKQFILVLVLLTALVSNAQNPLWMRYPAISPDGSQVAFSYKGDIYKVSINGGKAIRLTTHEAFDSNPVWSPQGDLIAFISDRKGSKDIYVMPSEGGAARRLTTHSAAENLWTFTPDGKHVVFSAPYQDPVKSALFPTSRFSEVYKIPSEGGRSEMIAAFPADKINFGKSGQNFLYQDVKGFENPWRKHHTSSVTRDILEYDIKNGTHIKLIDWEGEDTDPVYSPDGNALYFLSERSGTFNVYTAPLDNPSDVKQLTNFQTHPVRFLSVANNETLCFGYDGEIYTLKQGSTNPQKLNISISTDVENEQIKRMSFASGATSASNSPDGKQVAFTVRGEVFVTSSDYSTTKQITNTVAEEAAVNFGPDNRSLVYSSYRDGYWNVYIAKIAREEDPNFPNATLIDEKALRRSISEFRLLVIVLPKVHTWKTVSWNPT